MKLADIRRTSAILPPRLILHGKEGVGKTTLAARFPRPVFLQVEDGCPSNIEIESFGLLEDLDAVRAAITALGNEPHDFRTLVLDSVDALEAPLWAAVCASNGWGSIESPGYGRGYVEADKVWLDLLAACDWLRRTRGMTIVLLGHSAIETVNDPRAPSYTSYQLRLHKRARGLIQDWADVVGFLATDFVIKSEDSGFAKKRVRADGGTQRYLHFESHPAFTAKNRYGLPAKLAVPLDFDFASKLAPFFPSPAPTAPFSIRAVGESS
jgi:AAA domain